MSSGFVSGGTVDAPTQRSDAWLAAQTELEAERARKAAVAAQQDGRSLYETLEANKAAKQDAFEEANRLKNQFRSLDEDEIEFLDSVLESTRAAEDKVRRETAEGLEAFRRGREESEKKAKERESGPVEVEAVDEEWKGGKKRKRKAGEKQIGGLRRVRVRRESEDGKGAGTSAEDKSKFMKEDPETGKPKSSNLEPVSKAVPSKTVTPTPKIETPSVPPKAVSKPGLVDYGSDEDDD